MRAVNGVEWAAHACAALARLAPNAALKAAHLAAFLDVPPAYLAKQMQSLSKAGLVRTVRGPNGGYRLSRSASAISLWEIYAAIDGAAPFFRCTEIRQNGPCGMAASDCRAPCGIAAVFAKAERAYGDILRSMSLEQLATTIMRQAPLNQLQQASTWFAAHASDPFPARHSATSTAPFVPKPAAKSR